jgi:SAM-dependent methyltransferase
MYVETQDPVYDQTRQAWRDIWTDSDFERELETLSYRRSQELINSYLPYLDRTAPTLEAGCGLGQVVYYLRQRGYPTIGIDYAPEALRPNLTRFSEMPLHMGDVHFLPYRANTFGGYLSFGVVEHFEEGPKATLAEAYRVLKPGGALVLTVPHPNFVEWTRDTINRLFPARLERLGPRAHYFERTYNHGELAQIVLNLGFVIRKIMPLAHSYTFFGLGGVFRKTGYYETSALAELAGRVGRAVLPWNTAFASLIIATKP